MSTLSSTEIKKNLYGVNHEHFVKASAVAIQKGLTYLQGELAKPNADREKLLFPLLDALSVARAQIAKESKSPHAKLFGHRRDAKGADPELVTYLSQHYLPYGDRLKTMIGKYLPKLMKGEKPAAGDQEYQIHFRTFDIPSKKTVEHEGKTALAANSLQHGTDLFNAITYAKEGQMQGDIFSLPPDQLRFVSAQLSWKDDDKMIPAAEYLCLYDATLSPKDAVEALMQNPLQEGDLMIQNAACVMVKHMDKSLIQSQLERIVPLFKKVVMCKNPDEATLKKDLASIAYRFAFPTAYERGSASINEWLLEILAGLRGYKASFPAGTMIDCEAFSTPYYPHFEKKFLKLLTLTKT